MPCESLRDFEGANQSRCAIERTASTLHCWLRVRRGLAGEFTLRGLIAILRPHSCEVTVLVWRSLIDLLMLTRIRSQVHARSRLWKSAPLALSFAFALSACHLRARHPEQDSQLEIEKVVLYRNGVGYFDYIGFVEQGRLRLRVPREHLNDILKSLTVVDPHGQVLRVSMPLDATAFSHQQAFAKDQLHEILGGLRGTPVELGLKRKFQKKLKGRIFAVEALPTQSLELGKSSQKTFEELLVPSEIDYRVSLLNDKGIVSTKLSMVESIHLLERGIRLSLNRALDSSSGQSSMQLVDVDIFVSDAGAREVEVSYVVEAPVWKPTYRVVIPGDGKNQVLLQGWAVVHNMSGEDWNDVELSLAAGAPIAFRYDMHRPSRVTRQDLSWMHGQKQVDVAVGDASQAASADDEAGLEKSEAPAAPALEEAAEEMDEIAEAPMAERRRKRKKAMPDSAPQNKERRPARTAMPDLARSVPASKQASNLAGLTKIDLAQRLSIPQGRSSMLAFVNERVPGKAALLYRAGGAGPGYANHPYRVLRFRNETPLLLESGPISLYAGGTFVGEGIADPIGSGAWATIPYAVETEIEVVSDVVEEDSPLRVLRISSGVLEVEQFAQSKLTWRVQGPAKPKARSIYIDQMRSGPRYELVSPSPDSGSVEVFPDFYRLHVEIPPNKQRTSIDVVEKTPSSFNLSIWDGRAIELLEYALSGSNLSQENKARLTPIVELRRKLGAIDTKLRALGQQRSDLEFHAEQIRRNLRAIEKDRAAKDLRKELSTQLLSRSNKIDALGRKIVALRSERLEKRLKLETLMQEIDLDLVPPKKRPPQALEKAGPPPKAQTPPAQIAPKTKPRPRK